MTPAIPSLPAGATDCHFHIFDARFPTAAGRQARASATVADYLSFHDGLGLARGVVVAPSTYGHSNECLFESMERFGSRDFRAVAMPPVDLKTLDWEGWHARGVRGLRLYTGHADFPDPVGLQELGSRAAEFGWHLQMVGEQAREPFAEMVDVLAKLACSIVFDHFGFAPQPDAARSVTASALHRLLDLGRTYVKLSGMYIQSRRLDNDCDDFDEMAIDLVRRAPGRLLWGSDWPHTLAATKPDGHRLLQRLEYWVPALAARHAILVDNPASLYWAA
ncbi:amidohydrolase family protein [Variovorax rhizosphaerae]|uniref:Amidohydrolase family protein n=1 Tax=Variovorax rhizosphaerae TaxID=1836200 RepID=A0ABU8WR83_9BURK